MRSSNLQIKEEIKKAGFCSRYGLLAGCLVMWMISSNDKLTTLICDFRHILVLPVIWGIWKYLSTLKKQNRLDWEAMTRLVLVIGFLIRCLYVLMTPHSGSKHDLGSFVGLDEPGYMEGHLGYMEYLYKYHHLPDFDVRTLWSYYNPPFFHIVCAVFLGINKMFGLSDVICYENLQILTLCVTMLIIWYMHLIMKEYITNKKALFISTGFLSMLPFMMIFSGTLNNDCFCAFFVVYTMWCTICWKKERSYPAIIRLALAIGLGMATKLNVGFAAVGVAMVFLMVLWEERKSAWKLIRQFMVFGVICVPLGLFYPIKNWIAFRVPFNFVQRLEETHSQYLGEVPFWDFFGVPSWEQVSYALIAYDTELERNMWVQLIRTSLFNEWYPLGLSVSGEVISYAFWFLGLLLAVVCFAILLWMFFKRDTMDGQSKCLFGVTYIVYLISLGKFAIDFPFICTMNYRYIYFLWVIPTLALGLWLERQYEQKGASFQHGIKGYAVKALEIGVYLFMILGVLVSWKMMSFSGIMC